jgi:hypothetical protein
MKAFFLINGILYFGIFLFFILKFVKHYDTSTKKIAKAFSFIGIIYFLISLFSILWFFNLLDYSQTDFLFLYSLGMIVQSFILFRVVYLFSKNKNLYYFLGFYVLILFSLFFSIDSFLVLSLIASSLFGLLIFINFAFLDEKYKKAGYFGILYFTISIILNVILLIYQKNLYNFSFISGIFFFLFSFFFFGDLRKYPLEVTSKPKREKSYFFTMLSHLVFIIVLTNFIFIGTVGIHEFGHYGASKLQNCEYQQIVYDGNFFHTDILCEDSQGRLFVTLGGILLPFLIAILLFLIGGNFIKEIAFLIFGFNFVAISRDLSDLGISDNLVFFSIFVGIGFLIYGLYLLAKSKSEETLYFGKSFKLFSIEKN